MYGSGKYVFDTGNQFAYEIISNNLIKVCDGYAMNQGRLMGIDNTLYEELIIDNGLQGVKRVDLICMKYTKNAETGIENVEMVVVKGTSGDNYTDPSIVSGDILAGAAEDDFPLYRVKIDGINIVAVEPLFNVMISAQELIDKIGTANISSIGSGTITGAISALNSNLINIGNIYSAEVNITNPAGEWKIGAQLVLSAGTYIIFRRGYSIDEPIIIGKGYSTGDYVSAVAKDQSALYVEVRNFDTEVTISNFIFGNSDIYNGISAVRIG